MVGNSEGIFRMRTIRRERQGEKWSVEAIENLSKSVGEHLGGIQGDGALTVPARSFPAEAAAARGGGFLPTKKDIP